MRADGLSAVLDPLLDDGRIVAAVLVDGGSGLLLDGYAGARRPTGAVVRTDDSPPGPAADLELVGALHVELLDDAEGLRATEDLAPVEIVLDTGDGHHHLVRGLVDPHGGRLVLGLVVRGTARHVARARRRLRRVSEAALTAGPTLDRRPVDGTWFPSTTPLPAVASEVAPGVVSGVVSGVPVEAAPPPTPPAGAPWRRPEPGPRRATAVPPTAMSPGAPDPA